MNDIPRQKLQYIISQFGRVKGLRCIVGRGRTKGPGGMRHEQTAQA